MDNFCTSCGTKLNNGVCPVCTVKQYTSGNQGSVDYNANYTYQVNQQYNQIMICPNCGTHLINGVCPTCSNRQMMNMQHKNDARYKGFFMSPKESLVATLGNSYIQTYFKSGKIANGFAVVSDKRVYFHGMAYNLFYDAEGFPKATGTARSQTIDLRDVTGTTFTNICDVGLKASMYTFPITYIVIGIVLGVLLSALGTADSYFYENAIPTYLIIGIIIWIIIALRYLASKLSLISIQYAGGEIAFNINWFPQEEIADFQRQIRLAKDKVIEESENAVSNQINYAMNNMNYSQGYKAQPTPADELMKYADLLQRGFITQEEFDNARRRLLNG